MSSFKSVLSCLFTPRLIKIYGNGPVEQLYEPNTLEQWGDKVINSLYIIWKFSVYTSPFLVGILYRKGYFLEENLITFSKFVTSIGVILVVSYCLRGLGRSQNPTYKNFIDVLTNARCNLTPSVKQQLATYDFEFFAWPVEYSWNHVAGDGKDRLNIQRRVTHRNSLQFVLSLPCQIISYLAVHSFGIRLIYPGSVKLLQILLGSSLLQGRSKLVEVNRGIRYKLLTKDKNDIDVMYVNRRTMTPNGNTLVVCCEGNAGFYEIGIMGTAIEAGYSVLGWNHPGFGGSTGQPYPEQEQNAIDLVMQFAINVLGYKPEQILLFGWSIGGYTVTWAAMNYPEIKGIVLDATFDDLLPIALNQMPSWWSSLVKIAIRDYVNLHNFEQLVNYPGPILLIRRTEDEVICLRESDLSSNRGNNMLIKLLRFRYPFIMQDEQVQLLQQYLSVTANAQDAFISKNGGDEAWCSRLIESYMFDNGKQYPMKIGDDLSSIEKNHMTLFLAGKYMKDFKATHCTVLPADMLQLPWDINVENGFVFT